MRPHVWTALLVAGATALTGLMGCATESYCFDQCDGDGKNNGGSGGTSADAGKLDGFGIDSGTGGFIQVDSGSDAAKPDGCLDQELCNGLDDNCNGEIDENIDYTRPQNCGNCATNCTLGEHLVNPGCTPPSVTDGTQAGTCTYEKCESEFYDLNGDPKDGCEYYCPWNPDGSVTTDSGGTTAQVCGRDDDCDGTVDEDVNTCNDVLNCGRCGKKCVIPNGTAKCETTAGSGASCDETNTKCQIDQCDPGFYDVDGSPDNGCEYQCSVATPGPEVCDGIDNDCDGLIDNADPSLETDDANVGKDCFGGASGECSTAAHKGKSKCIGGSVTCCDTSSDQKSGTNPNFPATGVRNGICKGDSAPFVLRPGDIQETCNGKDDDCDNQVDDSPIDVGGTCGSSVGSCRTGTIQCISGAPSCQGAVDPTPDICNGRDDNCDGVIDGVVVTPAKACTSNAQCTGGATCVNNLCTADAVGMGVACDVPPAAPPGATTPCSAGTLRCQGGSPVCNGSVKATSTTDTCGVDANCDGTLSSQPDLQNDVRNCGACGRDCFALNGGNGNWTCNAGTCAFAGCKSGFIDCSGSSNDCETACSGSSGATELCNGIDDNCDCQVDNVAAANKPTPAQVCGVSPAATDPNCTTNVAVACQSASWRCTFPSGYCTGGFPDYCSSPDNTCNAKDDNCNGTIDDDFQLAVTGPTGNYVGKSCFSDDGKPTSDGICRTSGTYQCDPGNSAQTKCTAVKNTTLASAELCDALDNDCDGDVDETFNAPGSDPRHVAPAVRNLGNGVYMYMYEASRPGATATNPGTGNGWHSNPPSTETADETLSCSVPSVVPWFNVTPAEAAQTCAAVGGRLCNITDWQTACRGPGGSCTRGYAPASACTSNGSYPQGNPHCNIGPYDWDGNAANGVTDGLLPTAYTGGAASPTLSNCRADWSGSTDFFDIMGNLREITWNRSTTASNNCTPENPNDANCLFSLMGGAYDTQSEDGASCSFSFYTVNTSFKLFDVGFRCCFDSNPQ
ncbi:MAG: MopE-related protein [Polyangiaceae bacterium]